jgi:alkanesulfonate monooxygenase SsuD/methylene tetrahydromethanopterin reductase-like flavin-dependent oxidoreductase (luciferase family)
VAAATPAAAAAAAAAAGATPSTGAEVISLLSDSEDEAMPAARNGSARSLSGSVRRRQEVVDLEDSDDEAATPTSPKRQRGTDSDDTQSPLVGGRQQVSNQLPSPSVKSVSAPVFVNHCKTH